MYHHHMETQTLQVDGLWPVAFAAKLAPLSNPNLAILLFVLGLLWLGLALTYWLHPGGPAWGQYWSRRIAHGNRADKAVVPGPRGVPFLGSLGLMSGLAHHKLAEAAEQSHAKRLMAFSLGETRAIVTSNPNVAKEILNSSHFADRPIKDSAYSLMFHRAIGFAPYGMYWRTLRRIAAAHLFCPRQIVESEHRRQELATQMSWVISNFAGNKFQPREILKAASLKNLMSAVFGREYDLRSGSEEADQLHGLVDEGYDLLGKLNWSDHVSWLAGLDLQKVRFRCSRLMPKVKMYVCRIIREHRDRRLGCPNPKNQDFVDVLLSLNGPEKLSESDMIAVLWEMIFRGTDTIAVLIEWILARMVLHPDVQSKVHEELDRVVGKSRAVVESDLQSLVYLPAVVKEVLRLHPPGPLLSWARLSIADTSIDGYHVPAGTTAMVNMWAIARDPEVWDDPLSFKPERFVNGDINPGAEFSVFGSDLRLAPFGSGRRVCPGKALGMTTVSYWFAHLMHGFEWVRTDPVDLGEVLRLSSEMANPLTVKAKPRLMSY